MRSVYLDSKPLITQISISPSFSPEEKTIFPECKYVLSRFAYARKLQDQMVLESPLSHCRIILQNWIASAAFYTLSTPCTARELSEAIPTFTNSIAREFMNLLLSSQMLSEVNEQGRSVEDETISLQCWEFHDLLFHTRSRGGRHDSKAGGTYRFLGRTEIPPALKEIKGTESIDLYQPNLKKLQQEDPPYALVQEERRSIRQYGEKPISAQQLGEFLYRVGRMTDSFKTTMPPPHSPSEKESVRPYPAGGGLYELELYVAAQRCEGLDHGLYLYDPQKHLLVRITAGVTSIEPLLREAGRATTIPVEQLQILIILSARFQRIAWKYESIAYALILKNAGVLYQTMYLAATAMGLAPCAVGYGDSDYFSKIAGTEYFDETSVGEFLIGSRKE